MNVVGLTTSTADRKRRAGQRLIIGLAGTSLNEEERSFIRDAQPGGFILFARNVEEPRQVLELNRELASLLPSDLPPIRCVDQEGGRVQRVKSPATVWPPMRWVGNVGDLAYTREVGRALAREVRALGFDLDFAPDADVDSNPKNPIIGDRAFSADPGRTAAHVAAFVQGMQGAGCIACAKHFPGHGDTATDSHLELPCVEKDPPDLEQVELPPFQAAIDAGVATVMTAHVVYPAWDAEYPATMSPRILNGLLRQKQRFEGVIISDDLEMKAVRGRWPLHEQLSRASSATVDVFLACKDLTLVVDAWESLIRLQEEDKRQEDAAIDGVKRWHRLRERFLVPERAGAEPRPSLSILGSAEHMDLALRARVEGMA
ncbi:MAG: beta-N-acetylhexosaminidase [Myxococcales bacterium]|nr:beta-N-acetylhexosaminidase [Myxococcales bacterium]